MQPGVKTAPGIFQELMTTMLAGLNGAFAFIDDIIIGGINKSEHDKLLFDVLERIQDYGFKLRIEKCEFARPSILFCGHIIDAQGVKPDPEKIQAIQTIPAPRDIHQLRSFLGAANYYGKFVKNIKDLRGPLDELTLKGANFEWQQKHQDAFDKLKEILASDLVLTHYDPAKKIVVAADASCYGKGGAILHEFSDRTLHPIMYVSSTFTAAENNYSQIQREAIALVFAVKRFHKYIYGRKFELHTDHKPLLTIFGSKQGIPAYTASRLQRYALILLAYDFDIKYVNTGSFGYADIVSRLIAKHPRENEDTVIAAIQEGEEVEQCFAIDAAKLLPVKFADIQEATQRCATLKKVIEFTNTSWPQKRNQIRNPEVAAFFDQREGLIVSQNCLLQDDRVVVPSQFRKQILEELHFGHPGCTRMKLLARSKVFWPGITADIERTVKMCKACATNARTPIKCSLQPWPIPTKPWSRIHADYAGPVNGAYYLVIVDAFSNWPEIFESASMTSVKSIEMLRETFARHGLCDTLLTDNGPQFTAQEFKTFCEQSGVEHILTAPYHPQSNGRAERFVDILKTGLEKATRNADQKLREFLTTYRFTPSYKLGNKSPSELLNGRTMKTRLDLLHPQEQPSSQRDTILARQFDRAHGARWKEFVIGASVYYQLHKTNTDWQWTPAIIVNRLGTVNYTIKLGDGRVIKKTPTSSQLSFPGLSPNIHRQQLMWTPMMPTPRTKVPKMKAGRTSLHPLN
ncbi:PREDICTED: uncharacterized protein K02A2.6-like [Cyphomyrmex costatus]|uniref:uncharacterized protein K02A2.6-like n=1 Tax=Cyphomyrmex costatus TaxID=456900 RepID=UPI0008522C35|nr:PREDICTED: uncharacterized protein K02A2.6-like [Cyphomyrmex costatus]